MSELQTIKISKSNNFIKVFPNFGRLPSLRPPVLQSSKIETACRVVF